MVRYNGSYTVAEYILEVVNVLIGLAPMLDQFSHLSTGNSTILETNLSSCNFLSISIEIFWQSFSKVFNVFWIVWFIVFSISLHTSSIWLTHLAGWVTSKRKITTVKKNPIVLTIHWLIFVNDYSIQFYLVY